MDAKAMRLGRRIDEPAEGSAAAERKLVALGVARLGTVSGIESTNAARDARGVQSGAVGEDRRCEAGRFAASSFDGEASVAGVG